jgi:hypothetical protein
MHMEDQDEEDDDDDDEFEELRSRLCPQLFGPENEDQEADLIALKTWTKDAGVLALYDLKLIASPSHAGNKFLRLGYLGDLAQLPYPVNKNRNKNNVGIMQTTEKRLDMLWNKYDAHLRFHLKPEAHDLLQSAWPARGELQRTPDWNEAEISQKGKKKAPPGEYIPPTESAQKNRRDLYTTYSQGKAPNQGLCYNRASPCGRTTSALRRVHIIATIHTHQETIPHLLNLLPPPQPLSLARYPGPTSSRQ